MHTAHNSLKLHSVSLKFPAALQIEEQKATVVSRRLVAASRSLADALYSTPADSARPALAHGWVQSEPSCQLHALYDRQAFNTLMHNA